MYVLGAASSATKSDEEDEKTNVHGDPPTYSEVDDAPAAVGSSDAVPRRATPAHEPSLPSEAKSVVPLIAMDRASAYPRPESVAGADTYVAEPNEV